MRVAAAFLANAAEEKGGQIYVLGGFWDTVNVPKGQPLGFRGTLVVRMLAARVECGRQHLVELRCLTEDGQQVFDLSVNINPQIPPEYPVGWDIPVTIVAGMSAPLPRLGLYSIAVLADNASIADLPFRAIEVPAGPQPA